MIKLIDQDEAVEWQVGRSVPPNVSRETLFQSMNKEITTTSRLSRTIAVIVIRLGVAHINKPGLLAMRQGGILHTCSRIQCAR